MFISRCSVIMFPDTLGVGSVAVDRQGSAETLRGLLHRALLQSCSLTGWRAIGLHGDEVKPLHAAWNSGVSL